MKKKHYIILGSALLLCGGIGFIISKNKKKKKCESSCCVEENKEVDTSIEKENKNEEEKIIEEIVRESLKDFYCPGDLVTKIVNGVLLKSNNLLILSKVPKNIEDLEQFLKDLGLYEIYEKALEEKYKRKD